MTKSNLSRKGLFFISLSLREAAEQEPGGRNRAEAVEEHCSPEAHGKRGLPFRQGSTPVLDTQAGNIASRHGASPWKCRATSALDFSDQSSALRGQLRAAESQNAHLPRQELVLGIRGVEMHKLGIQEP